MAPSTSRHRASLSARLFNRFSAISHTFKLNSTGSTLNGMSAKSIEVEESVVSKTVVKEASLPSVDYPPSPAATDEASSEHDENSNGDRPYPIAPQSVNPTKVLDVDLATPDNWLPRDPRLIRLTGVHPFNVEAPLTDLFNAGFLTPPELFYVRNHGAVPYVREEDIPDWEISIEGLVENPIKITFKEILQSFEQVTVPITLVCAGNRRKEQNQVRKTQGFSWGAAGVSTALFTGPMLADILKLARPTKKARYVCMEGADKLPNGYYGTSIRLSWVNDPLHGVMLAHGMNGEPLRPDHGKPIRVVIPGQIGGRSVKWLKRLIISDEPSDNWYHYNDNRVLPTMVTPEASKIDKKWWYDERYAIYELSVNSAIAFPAHEEKLVIASAPSTYKVKGYAYGGGGRRITRVELSLDRGQTWRLADVSYPEDLYRPHEDHTLYGGRVDMSWRDMSHCWSFWSIDVETSELSDAADIVVRAMDEAMNIQPRDMYWSVLGMMNNPWFRIAIHKVDGVLRFEHPTQPALQPGGWMERVKKAGGDLLGNNWGELAADEKPREVVVAEEVKMTRDDVKEIIEYDDLRKHDKADAPWFVVGNEVYNGLEFLEGHPGGATSIIASAGLDATDEFMAIHSESAKAMMTKYHIGSLSQSARKALLEGPPDEVMEKTEVFLNPRQWLKSTLIEKKVVSWDTRIFTFSLQHEEQTLGLPIGQHLMIKVKDEKTGEVIVRAYTPISEGTSKGRLELLVKVYFSTNSTPGGKMTIALDALSLGQQLEVKGPLGKLDYLGRGRLTVSGVERRVKSLCMVCGGSGITPIFQVLRAIMQDEGDSTKCVVFNGNRLEEDILCRDELDRFQEGNAHKCNILYTLSQPSPEWQGLKGRISADLVKKEMPRDDVLILICGPEALEKSMHKIFLDEGYTDQDMVFF